MRTWARLDLGDPSARALPTPQRDALERRLGRRVGRAGPVCRGGRARRVPGGAVAGCACGCGRGARRRRPLALARARRRARARCRRAPALPRTQSMNESGMCRASALACQQLMHPCNAGAPPLIQCTPVLPDKLRPYEPSVLVAQPKGLPPLSLYQAPRRAPRAPPSGRAAARPPPRPRRPRAPGRAAPGPR